MQVPFTWKPTGWFMVGWSAEFPVGEVRPLHYFGEDLVAWRTEDGELNVMDAHCPHLGAHIGHHGKVDGDCVQCPYHGWQYGTDGVNVLDPLRGPTQPHQAPARVVGRRAVRLRLRVAPAARRRPAWEMPDIFTSFPSLDIDPADYYRPYPELSIKYAGEPVHPQIPLENGPDSVHFRYVHSASVDPVLLDWEMVDQEVHFLTGWPDTRSDEPDAMALRIHSQFFGVGGAISAFEGSSQLPPGVRDHPGRRRALRHVLFDLVAAPARRRLARTPQDLRERIEKEFIVDAGGRPRDLAVPGVRRAPALAKQDAKPYGQLRKWAKQFYEIEPARSWRRHPHEVRAPASQS